MKSVAYQLERPFPDEARLVRRGEEEAYCRSKEERDEIGDSVLEQQAQVLRHFRRGKIVRSVADLERRLERDLAINPIGLAVHRAVSVLDSYFDNTQAAWRRAWE